MQKKCQRCGKTFTAGQGNYRYCDDCKKKCTPPKLVVEVATDNFEKMAESIDGAIRIGKYRCDRSHFDAGRVYRLVQG